MKMSDIWGWDSIPQSYGHYESFMLNGVERKGDFYGLLFCTEEAANAVSHAVKNHDRMADEIAELREFVKSVKFTMEKARNHHPLPEGHDCEMLRQQIARSSELLNK